MLASSSLQVRTSAAQVCPACPTSLDWLWAPAQQAGRWAPAHICLPQQPMPRQCLGSGSRPLGSSDGPASLPHGSVFQLLLSPPWPADNPSSSPHHWSPSPSFPPIRRASTPSSLKGSPCISTSSQSYGSSSTPACSSFCFTDGKTEILGLCQSKPSLELALAAPAPPPPWGCPSFFSGTQGPQNPPAPNAPPC